MAQEDLTLRQIILKSSTRAVPARKFVKLAEGWVSRKDVPVQEAQDELAAALLLQLVSTTSPPAILLSYLGLALTSGLISTTTLITHLLFLISDSHTFSPALLASISTLILSALSLEQFALSATLTKPATLISLPDVGPSTSASTANTVSTLCLLLPLLRQCSSPSPAPGPLVMLVSRILSLLSPYPAPPLDIGLEAGGLFQSLPESIAAPLRDCLSGLMADLAVSQDASQLQIADNLPPQPAVVSVTDKQQTKGEGKLLTQSLPPFSTQLPLRHTLDFQVARSIRSDRWTPSSPTMQVPPENHISLIRLGPLIASDSTSFLQQLIRFSLVGSTNLGADQRAQRWLFLTERLPILLKWWKDQDITDWPYPGNLSEVLPIAFESEKEGLSACDSWISSTLSSLVHSAEAEDESSGWAQPEGWMLCSQKVTLILRLIDLGLLARTDAATILPGMTIPSTEPGESLANRIASSPKSHLKALGHIIAYAPGAARSLATEIYACVQSCPQTQPQEGLFANLADNSTLLSCLGGCINPFSWLDVIRSRLLEYPDDPASRAEDPQGSKSRFGDGVVLAEAFIFQYQLPLPPLLRDARRAICLADLETPRRSCVNGWIKALFGSEGIDDEIILATSPADFYRLAPGIVQQSILATASGQMDLDTLHSGLSYFAQPLLSWSLAGICFWLIEEVRRNGLISAPYLDCLQALALSPSFPESTLRIIGNRLADLVQPSSGLDSVFKTSGFDVNSILQKLNSAGLVPSSNLNSSATLRQQLQACRTLDLATPSWASALLDSLETSAKDDGPVTTIEDITAELVNNLAVIGQADTFPQLVALLVAQRISVKHQTLLFRHFIATSFPRLFDTDTSPISKVQSAQSVITAISRAIKSSLLVLSHTGPSTADVYAAAVVDELVYQRQRPSKRVSTSPRGKKRRVDEIGEEAKEAVKVVIQALGADEELKSRWERFSDVAAERGS